MLLLLDLEGGGNKDSDGDLAFSRLSFVFQISARLFVRCLFSFPPLGDLCRKATGKLQ